MKTFVEIVLRFSKTRSHSNDITLYELKKKEKTSFLCWGLENPARFLFKASQGNNSISKSLSFEVQNCKGPSIKATESVF